MLTFPHKNKEFVGGHAQERYSIAHAQDDRLLLFSLRACRSLRYHGDSPQPDDRDVQQYHRYIILTDLRVFSHYESPSLMRHQDIHPKEGRGCEDVSVQNITDECKF